MSFLNIFVDLYDWFMIGGTFTWYGYAVIIFFFAVFALVLYQLWLGYSNRHKGQGLGRQSWKIDLEQDLVRLIKTKELNDFWNKEMIFEKRTKKQTTFV